MKPLLAKTGLILLLLILLYFLFIFWPQKRQAKLVLQDFTRLSSVQAPLLENYLALSQIPRLDQKSPNFAQDQENLLTKIEATREKTLAAIGNGAQFGDLLEPTRKLLADQPAFLDAYQPDSESVKEYLDQEAQLLEGYNQKLDQLKQQLLKFTAF